MCRVGMLPGGGPGGFFISLTPRTPSMDCGGAFGGALGGGGRAMWKNNESSEGME